MTYKLINNATKEETICSLVTIDGFDYYYIEELIPYNPNGGTNGNFVCLCEIESNKQHNVKLGDKRYISPFVTNVGSCGGCRKLIATTNLNVDIDIPKVIDDEVDNAFHIVDDTKVRYSTEESDLWISYRIGFGDGYLKAKEKYKYIEKDLEEFYIWKDKNRWFNFSDGKWEYSFEHGTSISKENYDKNYRKTTKELLDIWKDQQIIEIYYE